jgi:hypothetical protein
MRKKDRAIKRRNIYVLSKIGRDYSRTQGLSFFPPFMVWCFWSWWLVGIFNLESRKGLGKSRSS